MAFLALNLILTKLIIFMFMILAKVPLISFASTLKGNETDKIALLEFKKMIRDDPYNIMSSWNETVHFCQWFGVECGRRHQRVTSINLDSLRLEGSLPPHIGNLSFLGFLDLAGNGLSGKIPQEIGYLHRLQFLFLNNNSFSGSIPSNISTCRNLQLLSLGYNNLVGNIPPELGMLTNLRRIYLLSNHLSGKIPHSLGNLSSITYFYLSFNDLVGEVPDSICRLPRLQYFEIGENNLSGTIPSSLYNHSTMLGVGVAGNSFEGTLPSNLFTTLPQLIWFLISRNNFTGNIPVTLSNATNIQFFYTVENRLTGKVPNLGNLRKLQRLSVAANHLGKGGVGDLDFLSSLVNATDLEALELGGNNFGGFLPESISNLSSNLRILRIMYNSVSGNIPRGISSLTGLEGLYLAHNKFNGEIPDSVGFLSNLKELQFEDNNLSGKIPSSFGNLTLLTKLNLGQNYLSDSIPASLGNCKNLLMLELGQNNLSGSIPKEVLQIPSLSNILDLSHNHLIGSITKDVGDLKTLGYLDFSYNSLSGNIPVELGSCVRLEMLNLMKNNLQGTIPSSLGNLRALQVLEISNNNLTGEIPSFLKDLKLLNNLSLSHNDFVGVVPTTGIFGNASSVSVIGNKRLCGGIPKLNLPKCNTTKTRKKKSKSYLKIVLPLVFGILGIVLAVILLQRRLSIKPRKEPIIDLPGNPTLRVSYHTLFSSTNGFSSDNLLGVGGFGAVYKGSFSHDETFFAVKVLNLLHHGASRSFVAECEVLRNTRHRNLVKVLTACSGFDLRGNDFKALVYEYMDNGNLEIWLHSSPQEDSHIKENHLSFAQRLNILIDVACAVDYLHNDCEPAIIHCDLKPSNVLLDKNMIAHVSDFGLARFVQQRVHSSAENHNSTGVHGTIGYAPPEYGMGTKPSKSGDVYSFGILILEMFTGRRPTDELFADSLNLHTYAKAALGGNGIEIVDPKILQESDDQINNFQEFLVSIVKVGVACSLESPTERMNIHDALGELFKSRDSFLA